MGPAGPILEPFDPFFFEAAEPLMAGRTADAVVLAELGEVEDFARVIAQEMQSFFHG